MSLSYSKYFEDLKNLLDEAILVVKRSGFADTDALVKKFSSAHSRLNEDASLRIVLVGEFSAGKSSIISGLTGANVLIDADVATDRVSEYPWNGLVLVDTPGLQSDNTSTDHDRIAREATIGADIVLFVITNELFNPKLAAYLCFVLDEGGLGLAMKTCIVVNKIDRESNADETLISEIIKVLGPHQEVPAYLCSASKFLQSVKESEALRARFERQSRFRDLIDGLDRFVTDAGKTGHLATPLSVVNEVLDMVQMELVGSDDDRKRIELIRRQRVVLQRLQRRLLDIRKTWKQLASSTVIAQANGAVEQISKISRAEDLEALFESGLHQATAEIDQIYDSVEGDMNEALDQAAKEIAEIGDSPFGQDVARIEMQRAQKVGIEFSAARPDGTNYVPRFVKAASKPLQDGLKEAAKNSKGLSEVVYKVGKKFGKKFRPYEALKGGEKLAKTAGKFGKAVPLIATALDFYIQYSEEKAKEEKERYLAKLRLALRSAFSEQAKVEAETLEASVLEVSRGPIQETLKDLDKQEERIAASCDERANLQSEICRLKIRCTSLRDELYCGKPVV